MRRAIVVIATGLSIGASPLARVPFGNPAPLDGGAVAAWQMVLKLQTVASIMHTTAHPDDEQGELLALLGRGHGVRTALLTLTRGEAGDNAIGPELFDALGLIRTDELVEAARSYGLDEQYFTAAADYGFSKRPDEALVKWDRRALLGDMVRAIRTSRPLVVVSRWQGTPRDGHGQHQAAGLLTPEAVAAAADPQAFPELAGEGLRPWRVRKVYSGGWRESDAWHVVVDPGAYDPLIGDSFTNIARAGLSLQRSQTAGRLVRTFGTTPLYYKRGDTAGAREVDFFDGLRDLRRCRLSAARARGTGRCAGASAARCGGSHGREARVPIHRSRGRLTGARPRARGDASRPLRHDRRGGCVPAAGQGTPVRGGAHRNARPRARRRGRTSRHQAADGAVCGIRATADDCRGDRWGIDRCRQSTS